MKVPRRTAPLPEKIDKLIRSIENALTGESFPTQVRELTPAQARQLTPQDWQFDWAKEAVASDRQVFQLTTVANPHIIHSLLSLEMMPDLIFMHLVESAPFNKGRRKAYVGVLGNLTAFACRRSFNWGWMGTSPSTAKASSLPTIRRYWKQRSSLVPASTWEPPPPKNSLTGIIPTHKRLTNMEAITTPRTIGIESREVDLTPICSAPLTPTERAELNAFFHRKRAENDKNPAIVALRKQFGSPCK